MTIDIELFLGAYVTENELPRTAYGRVYELLLRYQVEGSKQAEVFRWRWTYTDVQKAMDGKSGIINGHRVRSTLEKRAFIRQVQRELKLRGERLYSVEGQEVPVRGKTIARPATGECG
jgi:hypothetical protein